MPSVDTSPLLSSFNLGHWMLRNRVVMAPLTRSRSDKDSVPPPFAADYYAQRASAGLIVSEATNISAQAKGYEYTPGIWTQAQIASWRNVTAAVHQAGGIMVLQLWHTGRLSHPDVQPGGVLPVSASAVKPDGQAFTADGMKNYVTPRALGAAEIPGIVDGYRQATINARDAGFDGVEIHSANNYLLDQFVRDSTNRRTDEYGGSIGNRLRFPLAVAEAVTAAWDPKRVGVRLSPVTELPGGSALDSTTMTTYGTYISALDKLGLAYLHMIEGTTRGSRTSPGQIDLQLLRKRFRGAYIANNGFSPAHAAEVVRSGQQILSVLAGRSLPTPILWNVSGAVVHSGRRHRRKPGTAADSKVIRTGRV